MCAAALKESFCLKIPSQTRYLNLVTALAKRLAIVAGMDDATASKVSIAVDEAVTNIISHAYGNSTEHWVELEFLISSKALEIQVLHTGTGLREEDIALPDPGEYIKHPRKGGLGLLLMSRFMDEVHFTEGKKKQPSKCTMIKWL